MAAVEVASEELIGRLDSAVSEVFEMMLARSCEPMQEASAITEPITAAIRFSGAVEGECLLWASRPVAQRTAEALLGTVSEPDDPMVEDAIGELCNMVAGGWKSKLGAEQASCVISPPSVTTTEAAKFYDDSGKGFRRFYSFQGNVFGVQFSF
jgi:chemotaxis protein CheX